MVRNMCVDQKDLIGRIYKRETMRWTSTFMSIFLLPVHNHHVTMRNRKIDFECGSFVTELDVETSCVCVLL